MLQFDPQVLKYLPADRLAEHLKELHPGMAVTRTATTNRSFPATSKTWNGISTTSCTDSAFTIPIMVYTR